MDLALFNVSDTYKYVLNQSGANAITLGNGNDVNWTAGGVVSLAGTQTIAGTKTFSTIIGGSINGNAATATLATNATNASSVTNGVYTIGNQTIGGVKTFTNGLISNAALNVNGTITATTFAITNNTKFLDSNTALPTSNTDVDILTSDSLAAGTYLVNVHFLHNRNATTSETVTFKIYDGININASQAIYRPAVATATINGSLTAIVTLSSSGTIKLRAATSAGSALSLVLTGTKSTQMTIIKIG